MRSLRTGLIFFCVSLSLTAQAAKGKYRETKVVLDAIRSGARSASDQLLTSSFRISMKKAEKTFTNLTTHRTDAKKLKKIAKEENFKENAISAAIELKKIAVVQLEQVRRVSTNAKRLIVTETQLDFFSKLFVDLQNTQQFLLSVANIAILPQNMALTDHMIAEQLHE